MALILFFDKEWNQNVMVSIGGIYDSHHLIIITAAKLLCMFAA